ncbi:MAG: metal transporter [Flavobacterium sp. MedPE-SWcel]|uniref:heavy-metal-associated domain-containing protein n=1 Tax=uncultured Flavobacterium sp. TaxID=165435 RepID=UPI0009173B7D|nr:metal transporter [uncultured Flavobacterium sp.]OIQ21330.1 MAG: metal transporter [Flavobacterium sp. MedPE-SWcel]
MKRLILVMLVMLVGVTVQAQEKKKKKNAKLEIGVNGNCGMCKKRIEKAAFSVKGVKYAAWHEDHQDLHLILDENKCSVEDVRKAIAETGHDTDKVKAEDVAYDGLHECCKYKRE